MCTYPVQSPSTQFWFPLDHHSSSIFFLLFCSPFLLFSLLSYLLSLLPSSPFFLFASCPPMLIWEIYCTHHDQGWSWLDWHDLGSRKIKCFRVNWYPLKNQHQSLWDGASWEGEKEAGESGGGARQRWALSWTPVLAWSHKGQLRAGHNL